MGVKVMIEVPEQLYDQATELAQLTKRAVNEVLQEIVIRSFPPMYDGGKEFDAMEQEVDAFAKLHAELWEKYPQQFVAIYQGQVVDHDDDEWALLTRLELSHPDDIVLVRQVQPELPGDLIFHSPRFIFDV